MCEKRENSKCIAIHFVIPHPSSPVLYVEERKKK